MADTLIVNGRVFSGSTTTVYDAVAIGSGRILAVGTAESLEVRKDSRTIVVDAGGRWILPGFDDARARFIEGGRTLFEADLSTAASAEDAAAIAAGFARARPEQPWVLGRGWDAAHFSMGTPPTAGLLDAQLHGRPALLLSADGTTAWANTAALEAADVTRQTRDPIGGEFERDETGALTGVASYAAAELLLKAVEAPAAQGREALAAAMALARRFGVTTVQQPLGKDARDVLTAWREEASSGTVTVRSVLWGRLEDPQGFLRLKSDFKDLPRERFVFAGVEGSVDGDVKAHAAVLGKPYTDQPETRGVPLYTQGDLNRMVLHANALGVRVRLRAAGDGAARMALDAFAYARRSLGGSHVRNCVSRLELLDPRDLARFKSLGAVAAGELRREPAGVLAARLGASRASHVYDWDALEQSGATLAFASDWPDASLDPRVNLSAAGLGGSALARGLTHYTRGGAFVFAREGAEGGLLPGMPADLVLLGGDLFDAQGAELQKVAVDAVFFDGKPIYAGDDKILRQELGPF